MPIHLTWNPWSSIRSEENQLEVARVSLDNKVLWLDAKKPLPLLPLDKSLICKLKGLLSPLSGTKTSPSQIDGVPGLSSEPQELVLWPGESQPQLSALSKPILALCPLFLQPCTPDKHITVLYFSDHYRNPNNNQSNPMITRMGMVKPCQLW